MSEEPFYKLEVPTRALMDGGSYADHHSLAEALRAMTAPELMRGENKVECDHCGKRRPPKRTRTNSGWWQWSAMPRGSSSRRRTRATKTTSSPEP